MAASLPEIINPLPPGKAGLLMTATIAPGGDVRHARTDPAERLAEYVRALRFNMGFLGRCVDSILFVDNSGADLSALRAVAGEAPVSFLSYRPPPYPPDYGYGYGELHLIQTAMDAVGDQAQLWIKVTGRYRIHNLARLIGAFPPVDLVCDIKNMRAPWMDLRVFGWTRRGFDLALRDSFQLQRENPNRWPPEMLMALHILGCSAVSRSVFFPYEPWVEGVRGHDGRDWGKGTLRLRARLHGALRPALAMVRSARGMPSLMPAQPTAAAGNGSAPL